ncbi:C-_U-editing enzyme APOBEC-2a [Clinocottus analis]|uniref:C->U-editing enzyme APOBEC-2a n=1 Tax=Clinocottus analis TaxID=304258 RepID=UPI0035BFC928
MADKGRPLMRRKGRKEEASAEMTKDVQTEGEAPPAEANGDSQVEAMELPPFEIIQGDRIDPFAFKFQFKNVEYSSGRNKTFLCFLLAEGNTADGLVKGYLEDEHTGPHAEEAFFMQCLLNYDPALRYTVTWYVSSSPCSACAAKIAEVLKARTNVKLSIFAARLFEWEEAEIQAGLKALHAAGCKLRVMKPLDFSYTWETFVENEEEPLNLWEDCKENYEYYQEKLADILQ